MEVDSTTLEQQLQRLKEQNLKKFKEGYIKLVEETKFELSPRITIRANGYIAELEIVDVQNKNG